MKSGGIITELSEKTLSSKNIYDGRILHITLDEVELPDGRRSKREVVNHPGGVAVAALDADNNLLFVRQFRYPYKEVVLELPAGKLEKGATPLENGKRELLEETGAVGYSYISLGKLYPSPGYTSEIIHLYACRVQSQSENRLDEGEFLNVEKIPLDKAVEMVLNNLIPDSKTQTAVLKTAMLLNSGRI
ncbi:MAG: NUDIX hydrolase [Clostridiales bacterium]|nr:NUDIX hydrolase [Clostridiales bacterium]